MACKRTILILLFGVFTGGVFAPTAMAADREINVFAAASLGPAIRELADEFEQRSDVDIYINLASSHTLYMQIKQGAPADLFLSANAVYADKLYAGRKIAQNGYSPILTNRLVVVAHHRDEAQLRNFSELVPRLRKYLSVADTNTVPLGIYTKDCLREAGLWDAVYEKLAPALDARAALKQVELGNIEYGIAYASDAIRSSQVTIIYQIPQQFQPDIRYVVSRVNGDSNNELVEAFYHYLRSSSALKGFEKYGFAAL